MQQPAKSHPAASITPEVSVTRKASATPAAVLRRERANLASTAAFRDEPGNFPGPARGPDAGTRVLPMLARLSRGTGSSQITVTRRTEPRIAARIWVALGDARTILNVEAGSGPYEPPQRHLLAAEPAALMHSQRPADA